ncbi:hypothetical protein ACE14D_04090 [Streptomyces sp. Act-28]
MASSGSSSTLCTRPAYGCPSRRPAAPPTGRGSSPARQTHRSGVTSPPRPTGRGRGRRARGRGGAAGGGGAGGGGGRPGGGGPAPHAGYQGDAGYQGESGYQGEGYRAEGEHRDAGEYRESGYANGGDHATGEYPGPAYAEDAFAGRDAEQPSYDDQFQARPDQGGWPAQAAYHGGYDGGYAGESESTQGVPASERDGVGFDRPGSVPNAEHGLTGAGLPRRGGQRPAERPGQDRDHQQDTPDQQVRQAPQSGAGDSDAWRSTNDERWQRAGKLKEPKAGGVTASGLPRRVPKANLIEGTAEQTPQGGPQVSRAPEDVRGRLSNLRRGVQQGRNVGTDMNGSATYDRHSGPGSTYNQER